MKIAIDFDMLLPAFTLCLLLSLAVWNDVRTRRIPNRLVLVGVLTGLALNTFLPAGAGFFTEPSGALGPVNSLGGAAVGLATLLPLYALGAMGAGDVKLMAMVGAFLGSKAVLGAAILSLLAGGLLAFTVALWMGTLVRVLHNTHYMLRYAILSVFAGTGVRVHKPETSTSKLAYAIAIMSGTGLNIILSRTSGWSFLS